MLDLSRRFLLFFGILTSLPAFAIYRGKAIPDSAIPYVVLLRSKTFTEMSTCTGTLLRSNAILTAAHCVLNKKKSTPDAPVFYSVEILSGMGVEGKKLATAHTIVMDRNYLDTSPLRPLEQGLGTMEKTVLESSFASAHDIAIILTREDIGKTLGLTQYPRIQRLERIADLEGQLGIVVGYGLHDDSDLSNPFRATKVNARTRLYPPESPNMELRLYENGQQVKSTPEQQKKLKHAYESLPMYSEAQPFTFLSILKASDAEADATFGGVSEGDSGGPVFGADGNLLGLNSTAAEPRTIDPKYVLKYYDSKTKQTEPVLADGTHLNLNSPAARKFLEAVGRCQADPGILMNRGSFEICPHAN